MSLTTAPPVRGARELAERHWPAACFLLLVVASSDKWRQRDPTEAVTGSPDLSTLFEAAVYGLVAAWLLHSAARRWGWRHRSWTPPLALGAAYAGLNVLSVTYTPYRSYGVVRAGEVVVVLALAVLVGQRADRRQLHALTHAFLVLVAVSVAYGVVLPSPPVSALQVGRFTWLAVHPNVSGVFTAIGLVVAVAYLSGPLDHPGPRWSRWAYAAAACVDAVALVASQSRGAALGAVAGAVLVPLLQRRGRQRVVLALATLLVGGLLVAASSAVLVAFAARGEDTAQLATLNARTDLWGVAWQAVQQQPLYGYGIGSVRGLFYDSTGLGGGHNEVVNVTVELGAVGVLVWAGFVVAVLVRARPSRGGAPGDRALLTASVVTILVAGLFYDGAGAVTTLSSTWVFMAAGWTAVLDREARRRPVPAGRPTGAPRRPTAPAPGAAPAGR